MSLPQIRIDDDSFLKDHFQLPPLPEVVGKLTEAIGSGEASAKQIAELLSTDPGLVAQVLKVVNSAYYGLPHQIPEVKHAVAYLGLAEIQRIVLAVSVMKGLRPDDETEFKRFWEHSFFSALASRVVGKRIDPTLDADELHIAVLLHDLGKLVYMKFFPEHYAEMSRFAQMTGQLLIDGEKHFGFPSHQRLGALLCDRWSLPQPVKQACEFHELEQLRGLTESQARDAFLESVCLANLLANLAMTRLTTELRTDIVTEARRPLDCSEDQFLLLMGEIYDLKNEVANFLRDL